MKINKIIKIMFIFMIFPMILAFIINTQAASNFIEVKYEYNEQTNQVTAQIISNIELKPTKPTWELSLDKKTYRKTFSSNMNYNTPVETIDGEKIQLNIKITQIEAAKIETKYIYNEQTNEVTAQIISNTELKPTKPTWILSSDKKVYSKTFSQKTSYTTPVEDINGNVIQAEINITQIRSAKIKVEYSYDNLTNQVTAKIISDLELKDTKPTWQLSSDKKIYSKIYTENKKRYNTDVVDRYGNIQTVEIEINQIDITPPKITIEYKYNDDESVTVYMKSNEKIGATKPTWKLSEDQKTYQKTFGERKQNYSTLVQDAFGNETNVKIDFKTMKFTYKQEDESTITVRYFYTEHKKVDVEIISSVQMADTKPTWKYCDKGYKYTKTFYDDQIYGTKIKDVNGLEKTVNLIININDKYLNGIDVSVHQGKIDWEAVKASGIDFAILRCGYGQDMTSQDDKQFARNIAECERLGIPYGIYIYSYALNVENALSEADHVLRLIKGHNPQFGIWYDLEEDNYKIQNGMPSNKMFVEMAIAFCEKIKVNGYNNVGIYANTYWWEYILNDSRLENYKKWVAQWSANCTYNKPYQIWQYSENGIINGINTNVDMNIYYK